MTSVPPELRPMLRCPGCDSETPDLAYCVRCGTTLGSADARTKRTARREFAAAPRERTWAPHVASTLFPQLSDADMTHFTILLVLMMAVVVGLAIAGFYPLALTVATAVLPILMVLYLYSVDIYEREPVRVVVFTMLWGAVVGVGLGLWLHNVGVPLGPRGLNQLSNRDVLVRVVAVPLAGAALVTLGLLPLVRYKRFNDVLDGTTFGASSAITAVCVQTIVQAWPLLFAGFRPPGPTRTWVVQLVEIGVLVPLIWAGAVGFVGAALWLRFRAPVRDRGALGVVGSPVFAMVGAAIMLVAAYVGWQEFSLLAGLAWTAFVAAIAVIVLRIAIHVGLIEEADEIDIGPDVLCANCHRETPLHTFCARCGVALKALPKARRTRPDGGEQTGGGA